MEVWLPDHLNMELLTNVLSKWKNYQPEKRDNHCTVKIKDYLYMWGGFQVSIPKVHNSEEKKSLTSCVELFHLPTGKWEQRLTTGNPPLAITGYAATAIGEEIFYFGGFCGHNGCYFNSLNSLNVNTLEWKEISPVSTKFGFPSKKANSCMVPLVLDGHSYLAVVGGNGRPYKLNAPHQPGAEYINDDFSNEIHYYSLDTGEWISPQVTGDRPPPCFNFSLTLITDTSAIMFGGMTPNGATNNVYTVTFTKTCIHWVLMIKQPSVKWPKRRSSHSSVLIHDISSRPHLLVAGGYFINDSWLLDIENKIWKEINLPFDITKRMKYSLSVWPVTPVTSIIIAFGGRKPDWLLVTDTCAIVELRYNEWTTNLCSLTKFEDKIAQRRKEWQEVCPIVEEGGTLQEQDEIVLPAINLEHGRLKVDAEEKILRQNELIQEKDEQIEELLVQIKQKDKVIKEYQDKDDDILKRTVLEAQDFSSSWVIKKEDISVSDEVIGKGGWAEVRVATYCGLKVAAKCLHEVLLPSYNISIFTHEMVIASKIRHPNLLQFIGATGEDNPIIITELMPTSLRKELETGPPLLYHAVLNISLDVACALNYLHLFKPHPILHRDVSSANVLLQPMGTVWKAKVSDYGSANLQHLVSRTSNPGNPIYSSPESPYPKLHSPAMDVYSYGVLLLEMIIHSIPIPTKREAHINSIKRPAYKCLIEQCLKEEIELRPTMSGVINELNEYI